MYALSWFYLYVVGGLIYGASAYVCVKTGVLDGLGSHWKKEDEQPPDIRRSERNM